MLGDGIRINRAKARKMGKGSNMFLKNIGIKDSFLMGRKMDQVL